MKYAFISFFIISTILLGLTKCANPGNPTGGPKDTIPPTLINSFPINGSINFTGTEIELEFDEKISSEKLKTNLIITPQLDIKYKTVVKKNKLYLKFEDTFPDSTTVTLNFFDGITDVTEKNAAVNLSYVFSTGDFLDSMSISGKLTELLTDKPMDKYLIGLYTFTDTLDLVKTKPTYFTTTNKTGAFSISNIKIATYKLIAFNDVNRNLLFEPVNESHGFMPETITLDSAISNLHIQTITSNASELDIISTKTLGNYFDLRVTKGIEHYSLHPKQTSNYLHDLTTLRVYNKGQLNGLDSLQTIVNLNDSIGNQVIDTLFIKYDDNIRKKAKFSYSLQQDLKNIASDIDLNISFTKPIKTYNHTGIKFRFDSTYFIPADTTFQFNYDSTSFRLKQHFDTTTYFNQQFALFKIALDTITNDSIKATKLASFKPIRKIQMEIDSAAFISIEDDSSSTTSKTLEFIDYKATGLINLSIITSHPNYIIQLINKQHKVLSEYPGVPYHTLKGLFPGEVGFRIIIDQNNNGKWDPGNILKDISPEPVYLHPDFTTIRANWFLDIELSF